MKALITGITGMDGSYLAELLLSKGYEVHGIIRHTANELNDDRFSRIKDLELDLHYADLTSYPALAEVISKVKPDELYHLGAISYVKSTFDDEYSCFNTNLNGTHYLLDLVKKHCPECKFYFAGTSEMFGNTPDKIQTEISPFLPCSPYGISKYAAFNLCKMYRKSYRMYISCGILFNHTSERRGEIFATRKIIRTAVNIYKGLEDKLTMGNIDTYRDFGYAPEYVKAMWLMLQNKPDDFVIATNETHSIREVIELTFDYLKLDYKKYLLIYPDFYRPNELYTLKGDYSKAKRELGWQPQVKFNEIIKRMVEYDKHYRS